MLLQIIYSSSGFQTMSHLTVLLVKFCSSFFCFSDMLFNILFSFISFTDEPQVIFGLISGEFAIPFSFSVSVKYVLTKKHYVDIRFPTKMLFNINTAIILKTSSPDFESFGALHMF